MPPLLLSQAFPSSPVVFNRWPEEGEFAHSSQTLWPCGWALDISAGHLWEVPGGRLSCGWEEGAWPSLSSDGRAQALINSVEVLGWPKSSFRFFC